MFKRFMDYQDLVVWHPDSPGMRVRVRRNRFQRWFRSEQFAGVSEKQWPY